MAGFSFRYQTMLNLKMQLEENLKNQMAKAIQILEEEKAVLAGMNEEKLRLIREIQLKSRSGIKVEKLRQYSGYLEAVKERIYAQQEMVREASNVVEKYREDVVRAMQERKVLEKLKEKQLELYHIEELKAEQKVVDEIISYRTSRVNTTEENNGSENS